MKILYQILIFIICVSNLFSVYHKIAEYILPGEVRSLDAEGDFLYAVNSELGLTIFDISDITNPVLLSSYSTSSEITDVSIYDCYAVISVWGLGIEIIDISNPYNPNFVSSYTSTSSTNDAFAFNGYLYIPAGNGEFQIVDISNISEPTLIGSYYCYPGFSDVFVINDTALLSGMLTSGLTILDISDPTQPTLISSLPVGNSYRNIAVKDNVAILTRGHSGVELIDISDLSNPVFISNYPAASNMSTLEVVNDHIFITDFNSGFQVLDIENPSDIQLVGNYDSQGTAYDIDVIDSHVFIADDENGIQIVDAAIPGFSEYISEYDVFGLSKEIVVENDIAYINSDTSLQIVDVSNSNNIQPLGYYGVNDLYAMVYDQAKVYLGCSIGTTIAWSYFYIIDVSDPENPVLMGEYDTDQTHYLDIFLEGNYAFTSFWDFGNMGVKILDVENPDDICYAGGFGSNNLIYDIKVQDDILYSACYEEGLKIYDVSDFSNVLEIGSLNTPGEASTLEISYPYVYFADDAAGLQIIDISDPANPAIVGNILPHPDSRIIAEPLVDQDILIFSDYNWNELFIYNISDPSFPILIKTLPWNRITNDMITIDDILYTANDRYGITLLNFERLTPISENEPIYSLNNLSNYPNPFNPSTIISFDVEENETAELSIFNLKGQKLFSDKYNSGKHNYIWNATKYSSGVYFYKLKSASCEKIRKMILMK